jgi:hypothetical protein
MAGKDSLQARAAAAKRPSGAAPIEPVSAPSPTAGEGAARLPALRTKPVRLTVDLMPVKYQSVNAITNDLAARLGVPRVTAVSVVRTLLDLIAEDEGLQEAVARRLQAEQ